MFQILPDVKKCIFLKFLLFSIIHMFTNAVIATSSNGFTIPAISSMEHHGVQPTSCMDNKKEPSHGILCYGLSRKTDQFRLVPIQSCAHGRRCDWVSPVSSPHTQDVLQYLTTSPAFVLHAYQPPRTYLPPNNPP